VFFLASDSQFLVRSFLNISPDRRREHKKSVTGTDARC
jgi:hypothetical protein